MTNQPSILRVVVAALIALMGSLVIWFVVPYNNFLLKNSYVSDSFLPEIVVGLLILLILVVNPLLRLAGPRWTLDRRQVALICGLMLFAAILPSNGLMRMFPRFVAELNQGYNSGSSVSKIAASAEFRQQLFPDPLPVATPGGGVQVHETPVSDQFIDELDPGASIPWDAWLVPMASWGMLILAMWTMMIGLGGVVYPQWRDNERLPFPLLNVYHALIGDPDDKSGHVLPAMLRSRMFWIACAVVFIIHAFRGLYIFTGGAFPSFPLSWQLAEYFSDGVMRNAPATFTTQGIFFAVVGVAFFMPSRYSVSIWAWVCGYAFYLMLGRTYIPSFNEGQSEAQSFGVLVAITIWILWLGRAHWAKVGRAMLGRGTRDDAARRDAVAGWMFAAGCAAIVLWLYWAGCSLWWSVLAMVGCAVVSLLMARLIAETGIPVFWLGKISVSGLTGFLPLAWLSPAILMFSGIFSALLTRTTAVSAAVISTLALGLDEKASPSYHKRLMLGGLVVLVIGFVVCGAVHLNMGYRNSELSTQAKVGADVLNEWARVGSSEKPYTLLTAERGHQAAGFGIGAGLLWACARFPDWPIHPVGILFCRFSLGNLLWFSVFLGWLMKTAITRLFGGGAYRTARPLFLGLIIGELLAIMVWAIVPLVIIWATGADPAAVPRYTLMQYP
jgi:hypothetical protein